MEEIAFSCKFSVFWQLQKFVIFDKVRISVLEAAMLAFLLRVSMCMEIYFELLGEFKSLVTHTELRIGIGDG